VAQPSERSLHRNGDHSGADCDGGTAGRAQAKEVNERVTFELEFEGVATDTWGNTKAGFSAEAEINRKEWGLEWNVALEA
jgi:polyisoprenoid-binding protein YceI